MASLFARHSTGRPLPAALLEPPSVCLSVCLSVCASVCLCVCLSVRLSVCLCVCQRPARPKLSCGAHDLATGPQSIKRPPETERRQSGRLFAAQQQPTQSNCPLDCVSNWRARTNKPPDPERRPLAPHAAQNSHLFVHSSNQGDARERPSGELQNEGGKLKGQPSSTIVLGFLGFLSGGRLSVVEL